MKEKRKQIIFTILTVMTVIIIGVVCYYWYNGAYFISTEDAKVTGTLVKISPMTTGRIVDLFIEEGDRVEKNQIVGRLDVLNLADRDIEMSLVRSPISGVVIKKSGSVGEIISAGQILAYVVDPHEFYISANIEETKLHNLRTGQKVSIRIDQFKNKHVTGYVKSIGNAANSVFSLFPSTSSANFTKTVQKIPVHIEFDQHDPAMVNGTNAYVKIHIR